MKTEALTKQEDEAWRTFLHASSRLMSRLDDEMRVEHGERLSDFDVLSNLSESPDGKLRMSDLAERTLFSRSRLSYTVNQLEQRGLVERQRDENDKRGVTANLTRAGRTHHRKLARTHLQGIRRHFLDHSTENGRSQLIKALTPILNQLEDQPPLHAKD
jgi:DNA-binding MarR family transcriptional regulator